MFFSFEANLNLSLNYKIYYILIKLVLKLDTFKLVKE